MKYWNQFRKITTAVLLYLMLCGFCWCYCKIAATSYNRMHHEPVAMMQLTMNKEGKNALRLAEKTYDFSWQKPSGTVYTSLRELSSAPVSIAIWFWETLEQHFS